MRNPWLTGCLFYQINTQIQLLLACQDCQYNDLGVSAGRIGVLREKTLSIERPDGSSELRPAFAQVAMFYLSDPAAENVLKVQGRLQPQNIATDDEESSYDILVVLTQSVPSPQGRDLPSITKFFLAFIRSNGPSIVLTRSGPKLFRPILVAICDVVDL